jgi:NADH:ubiquinone oxidoreductase subunit F (NADH-binding)/(2Fe-2S) ferredoxin
MNWEEKIMNNYEVTVCLGTGCISAGSDIIFKKLEEEIKAANLTNVLLKPTGCHGFCQRGPSVIIKPGGVFYAEIKPEDVHEIVNTHFKEHKIVERLLYKDPKTNKPIVHTKDITFYNKQHRIVLRNCGVINPEKIEEYITKDGYKALEKVLTKMQPKEVIEEIKKSGLRGLGGAGFPAGRKWESCHRAAGSEKYVICNADEGDPGAFQDCSVLEGDPHSVLEGMIIAGFAVGARKGYIYARAEYPLAVKHLEMAIHQAREKGFIGENILGSKFSFDLEIFRGAGAFVCGESTALTLSIEGNRGIPKAVPRSRTTEKGLRNKPTLLNNVKTFANVRWIINKGADWFASIGTETCKGTAVFALTGHIANCGLVEVPMGTTLREIIFEIGGGIPDGKFKAVQTGGPSGGCLPKEFLDTPVDFDTLAKAGSIMGSGGMVVMNEKTCMVDVAKYFIDFTRRESCGKCVPCRLGTKQMLDILEKICAGEGASSDIDLLIELCESIKKSSSCSLGQTASDPVLTTLRFFREEYEAHVNEKRCPAGVCRKLVHYKIIPEKCIGCQMCTHICPTKAIIGEKKQVQQIVQEKCIQCGACFEICRVKGKVVAKIPGKFNKACDDKINLTIDGKKIEAKPDTIIY